MLSFDPHTMQIVWNRILWIGRYASLFWFVPSTLHRWYWSSLLGCLRSFSMVNLMNGWEYRRKVNKTSISIFGFFRSSISLVEHLPSTIKSVHFKRLSMRLVFAVEFSKLSSRFRLFSATEFSLGKTQKKTWLPHPSSPGGGCKCPSVNRMPRAALLSAGRYFKPDVPGNWACSVDRSSVPSSSVGNSMVSSPSSSATWMYPAIVQSGHRGIIEKYRKRHSVKCVRLTCIWHEWWMAILTHHSILENEEKKKTTLRH